MKIVCMGDSLTEGDYGSGIPCVANVQSRNYPFFLSQLLGCEVKNYGVCGITPSRYLTFYQEGKAPVADADLVLIMLGTNGGLEPDGESQGNADYEELVRRIRRDAVDARIVLMAPPHATEDKTKVNFGYMPQVRKAQRYVRALAAKENLPLIDFDAAGLFTAENEGVMQPNDGLHFGETGYAALAGYVADCLKKLGLAE